MRRIFYLITELDVGGAEKTLCELARRLDRGRFVPTVGCLTGRGPLGQTLEDAGIEVVYFDVRGWWDLPAWLRLRRELRERKPHVLHGFLFHANLAGRLAAVGLHIPRVISSVRVEEPRRVHLWVDRLTRGLVDIVTCVSESAREFTRRRAHIPPSKLVVIPNGVAIDQCDHPLLRPPGEWDLPEGAPVVASIGRLDRQKDPLTLLRAAERVVRQMPETHFVFAGQGPLLDRCRQEVERMGIERNIRWIGWVADLRPLLARMDLLALASRWEGMPNVVLEAMACRKPVVATAVGGTLELVAEGETGFLVPPGDDEALAGRILDLLQAPDRARAMGKRGRQLAEQRFSLQAMTEANQALYE